MVYLRLKRVIPPVVVLVAIHLEDKAAAIHSVDSHQHQMVAAVAEQVILTPETLLNSLLNSLDPKTNVKEVMGRPRLKVVVD